MRIFHEEALMIPNYLEECYEVTQALKNDGYLALLSPQFFAFGQTVMTIIAQHVHPDIFKEDGGDCLEVAKKAIFSELPAMMASFNIGCDLFHDKQSF